MEAQPVPQIPSSVVVANVTHLAGREGALRPNMLFLGAARPPPREPPPRRGIVEIERGRVEQADKKRVSVVSDVDISDLARTLGHKEV